MASANIRRIELETALGKSARKLFAGSLHSQLRPHLERVESKIASLSVSSVTQVDLRAWEESWKMQTVEVSALLKSFKTIVRAITSGNKRRFSSMVFNLAVFRSCST